MMSLQLDYDVVIVGYGPCGQILAALLGAKGWKVGVFERHEGPYGLPRAAHIDHEIMRLLQSFGTADAFLASAVPFTKYVLRNRGGEILLSLDWDGEGISGWGTDYLFYQPDLEALLDKVVVSHPTVSVHQGWEAAVVSSEASSVRLTVKRSRPDKAEAEAPETKTVRARYLIGADGANSFVRETMGVHYEDLGFNASWLVVDLKMKKPVALAFDNGSVCDPARPSSMFQLGRQHRRFEFMLLPGDIKASMETREAAWNLIGPLIGPDDAEIVRSVVYTFRSALVSSWGADRIFLIGDAAHLMPPFMGQGMCSGFRDATNLAWKLDLVLRGESDRTLLDTYAEERAPHVRTVIDLSVEIGRLTCTTDPREAEDRDAHFREGHAEPPAPFPWLTTGVVSDEESGRRVAGRLGPQGRIASGTGTGTGTALADDVVGGRRWQLICRTDPSAILSYESIAFLDQLDTAVLTMAESGECGSGVCDADGTYERYFVENSIEAIIVRPDFYVFGAAMTIEGLEDLVSELRYKLRWRCPSTMTRQVAGAGR
ncbi:bifunctional 3-(3-hydroxy-phenyl)propionate/3-hydroxycinnamic acid hydroxylase [Mesorhizobium waimense]|uniref:Bifunctional 3-(3-hydroxy-phenyl)propionate/3-hydroxycinnamic acid hydroxylase n=1 Tax=Mesorhizobium waimense TaxID=1300307 RepID=A0A3A5KXH0_9HYPH|nr:bifunctional 3-(3-hydroxy-phenyl)propionate/3-hydroxycinnamic acid hydroxylase [Mesorhizobium waimense]RJT41455.1 bifunctional 3-(3-hydroxy-phenyl)propionate/3-hydroxycinnamic acid hydroxylase [Mesorhizobium waimense]